MPTLIIASCFRRFCWLSFQRTVVSTPKHCTYQDEFKINICLTPQSWHGTQSPCSACISCLPCPVCEQVIRAMSLRMSQSISTHFSHTYLARSHLQDQPPCQLVTFIHFLHLYIHVVPEKHLCTLFLTMSSTDASLILVKLRSPVCDDKLSNLIQVSSLLCETHNFSTALSAKPVSMTDHLMYRQCKRSFIPPSHLSRLFKYLNAGHLIRADSSFQTNHTNPTIRPTDSCHHRQHSTVETEFQAG
ncbi:hypothetical protein L210DRAFT_201267 [Boletus edulis BED1]|uniref:Uncharacterized protein n=1 Tax=Boletus edulis BED1 TaxID=1328754 RepID=A0AAD4G6J2_BOLED|nr:hypothetical protein L210DRAFT_201267 [Boletus edulis BED1]